MAEASSLSYAVRFPVIRTYLGQLLFLAGALSAVPALFALMEGEWWNGAAYAVAAALMLAGSWALQRQRAQGDIQLNEALVVVASVFILVPLILALPMMAAGLGFLDSLFQAVSGITTTGLSTFGTVADKPRSLLFTDAWLQWIGGAAIMVLSFVLLFGQSASAKRLTGVIAEHHDVLGGTRAYATIVVRVYLGLTLIGVVAMLLAGAGWFPAFALTLSAVSTGGFSPFDDSLATLGGTLQTIVILVCFAGAIAAPLHYQLARGDWRTVAGDRELRALFIAAILVAVLLLLGPAAGTGQGARLSDFVLTAFSAQTTAGFSSLSIGDLDPYEKAVLIVSMLTGGSVGSSAGGLKLLRLYVFVRLVQLMILRTRLTPHAAITEPIAGRDWKEDELTRILAITGLFVAVPLASWFPFLWLGYDPLDSLFEVVSAAGTVGLSTGITGPDLDPVLKLVLCLDMLFGRLEVFPLLVLMAPRTWIGQRRQSVEEASEKQGNSS